MPEGYIVLVLHAHLPYVLSHGKWPYGSDWLCEAACETYIPLLNTLGVLARQGKRAGFTVGITPVLCEMLASPLFKRDLKAYAEEKIRAASFDQRSFKGSGQKGLALLASRWHAYYRSRLADFTDLYEENLLAAFRRFQEEGQIEIIVSAATHAYLPLLGLDSSIGAQLKQGIETYRKHFAREPEGMWLPECAYRPETGPEPPDPPALPRRGLEAFLAAAHLKYFFVDGCHVPEKPEPPSGYAVEVDRDLSLRAPAALPGVYGERFGDPEKPFLPERKGLGEVAAQAEAESVLYAIHRTGGQREGACAFFARDTETSLQVWSARFGYPGDPYYLEFHKKHAPGGLRYWRVTDHEGDLGTKLPYEPERALERVREHARHFARLVEGKLRRYHEATGRTGVLTVPFDAELFGHWWFEGIPWLESLASSLDGHYVTMEKAGTALKRAAPLGTVCLPEGSWGEGGGHLVWYNKETVWTWCHIHDAERSMERSVREAPGRFWDSRILRQMARELFLLQSSDWQFLITTRTAGDYGASRFLGHYRAFKDLERIFGRYRKRATLTERDRQTLFALEKRDALFDNVKPEWFKERMEDGL